MGARHAVKMYEKNRWVPRCLAHALANRWVQYCGQSYSFPADVFTTPRITFSLRRYHRHCPFFVASTNPAFVRIAM